MKRKERPHSKWLRCARFVASQYEDLEPLDSRRELPDFDEMARRARQLRRRLSLTQRQQWKVAEVRVRKDYHRQLRKVRDYAVSELNTEAVTTVWVVNEAELFRDLLVLAEEFPEAVFDKKEKRLSVVTKDISLDRVQLGAFRIELHLDSLSSGQPYYEVIAIDPNRPPSNDDVTHPHVQSDHLCEGDAQPAIRLALQQGRLLDFFQLVENVLGTYNPSSAYVTTGEWEGTSCGHCGHTADPDDCRECGSCEAFICDSCVRRCSDCEDCFCGNCDEPCNGCLESVCKSCIQTCVECDEQHCSNCLSENERCTSCEEKTKESSKAGDTETAVHAQCLGEAVVSS